MDKELIYYNFEELLHTAVNAYKFPIRHIPSYRDEIDIFKDIVTLTIQAFIQKYWEYLKDSGGFNDIKTLQEKFLWHTASLATLHDTYEEIFKYVSKKYPNYKLLGDKDEFFTFIVESLHI